jgi:hypothetical protein
MQIVSDIAARFPDVQTPHVPVTCGKRQATHRNRVPERVSELPDGTYRAEISVEDVARAGLSNGDGLSGLWTVTVEHGTYVLTCRPIEARGRDCGTSTYDGPLETGDLRGTGSDVWFVYDPARMAALTGCLLPASFDEEHCAVLEPYRVSWSFNGDTLTFAPIGASPAYHWPISPWRRIG